MTNPREDAGLGGGDAWQAPPPSCPRCGAQLMAGDRYCARCGMSLLTPVDPWAPAPFAPPPPRGVWAAYGAPVADWWPRVGSMLLDSLVILAPVLVINAVLQVAVESGNALAALEFVLDIAVSAAYFGVLNGTGSGQTLGNKAAGIAVRDVAANAPIGLGRGLLRWFVRFALYLFLVLPGLLNDLWPLWDRSRQTIADKAARTLMIRVR